MPYLIGIVLALIVVAFARFVGFDRDKVFYATVVIVVGSYYVLFAAMSQSVHTVVLESVLMMVFVAAAVIGFKSSVWFLVAGLAGHGMLDFVHGSVVTNAGVPAFWPAFCGSYDVAAGAILAWLVKRQGA